MKQNTLYATTVLIGGILLSIIGALLADETLFTWRKETPLTTFRKLQMAVDNNNCNKKPKEQQRLPHGVVSQIPVFNKIPTTQFFPNRSGLLHLHNMAMNRAFFYSYVLQRFNSSNTDFPDLPGLLYNYLSVAADVTGNPELINGSTLMYSPDSFYPNYYTVVAFNHTMDLFAARAIRSDDTFDGDNWLREPTLGTIQVYDMAGMEDNYTRSTFRNAPWYGTDQGDPGFVPDLHPDRTVGIRSHIFQYSIYDTPTSQRTFNFFAPPYPGVEELVHMPVRFTKPWFDCGTRERALNEWLVSSVSPVVDFMPRYSKTPLLQRAKYVAVTAMDTFLTKIPVNLCPISVGNPEVNLLANSDYCHRDSTICETLYDPTQVSQFLPESFQCRCKPGYSDTFINSLPYLGPTIAQHSTKQEYESESFRCKWIRTQFLWPSTGELKYEGEMSQDIPLTRRRRDVSKQAKQDEENEEEAKRLNDIQQMELHEMQTEGLEEAEKMLRALGDVPNPDEKVVKSKKSKFQSSFDPYLEIDKPNDKPKKHSLVPRFDANANAEKSSSETKKRFKRAVNGDETIVNTFDSVDLNAYYKAKNMIEYIKSIKADNCKQKLPQELVLPGTVSYGAETQFKYQAATAVRLAHFLSALFQNMPSRGDVLAGMNLHQKISKDTLYGEVMGNIAGDSEIFSSGILFAKETFVDSKGVRLKDFGPTAFRIKSLASESFIARDLAKFGGYENLPWFATLFERFAFNTYGLERFTVKAWIRPNPHAKRLERYFRYPMHFRAASGRDGYWSRPYYDCDGPLPQWLITYAVPFFVGSIDNDEPPRFGGVVTVTVKLLRLNINQCGGDFYTPNYFKDSNLCDRRTTNCMHSWGNGFSLGHYECHCAFDYAYPFSHGEGYFFLGSFLDEQFQKKLDGEGNLFDILKCRTQGVGSVSPTTLSFILLKAMSVYILISSIM